MVDCSKREMGCFGVFDFLFFCAFLLTFIVIGIYYGIGAFSRARTTPESQKAREFLTATNQHRILPAVISMFTYYISSLSLMSAPTTIYFRGTQYMVIIFSFPIAVLTANFLTVPAFYNLKIKTTMEYLEIRFDSKLRTVGCVIYSVNSLLRMAMWLYTPALVLERLSGIPFTASVLIGGLIFTFYTSIGGMRAVIVADLIQCGVIILSTLSVVVKAASLLGGFDEVWAVASEKGHVHFGDFDPNPFTYKVTFFTVMLGHTCYYAMKYCIDQSVVQRYMPSKSLGQARRALYWQIPLMSTFFFICCYNGLALFAYYSNCDPFLTRRIERTEELFPLFVNDIVGYIDGLKGIFVSGIFSGSLSSMSSALNSLSTLAFEDIVKRHFTKEFREKDARIFVRVVAIAYGVICIALVSIASLSRNTLRSRHTINTMLSSPLFGIFLLGILNRRATAKAALIALFLGILFGLYLFITHHVLYPGILPKHVGISECVEFYCWKVGPLESGCAPNENRSYVSPIAWKPPPTSAPINSQFDFLLRVSYHTGGFLCLVFTFIVGSVLSLCTKQKKLPEDLDPAVFAPFLAKKVKERKEDVEKEE